MKYLHLVQQPQFCGPTCVQMILLRRGKQVEQEEIAQRLHAKITEKDVEFCNHEFEVLPEGDVGLGMIFDSPDTRKALEQLGLTYTMYGYRDLKNPEQLISKALADKKDIIANLFWKPINGRNSGHYVLVEDLQNGIVTLCDSARSTKPRWTIKLDLLVVSMAKFRNRERGFIIFDSV